MAPANQHSYELARDILEDLRDSGEEIDARAALNTAIELATQLEEGQDSPITASSDACVWLWDGTRIVLREGKLVVEEPAEVDSSISEQAPQLVG